MLTLQEAGLVFCNVVRGAGIWAALYDSLDLASGLPWAASSAPLALTLLPINVPLLF